MVRNYQPARKRNPQTPFWKRPSVYATGGALLAGVLGYLSLREKAPAPINHSDIVKRYRVVPKVNENIRSILDERGKWIEDNQREVRQIPFVRTLEGQHFSTHMVWFRGSRVPFLRIARNMEYKRRHGVADHPLGVIVFELFPANAPHLKRWMPAVFDEFIPRTHAGNLSFAPMIFSALEKDLVENGWGINDETLYDTLGSAIHSKRFRSSSPKLIKGLNNENWFVSPVVVFSREK